MGKKDEPQSEIERVKLSKLFDPNIHNPDKVNPALISPTSDDPRNCTFFRKTGACKYGSKCNKAHPINESSTVILVPNFFKSVQLSTLGGVSLTAGSEYDEVELFVDYEKFFYSVIDDFKSCGQVIRFECSRNDLPHLKGNVYVQYASPSEAKIAFKMFNGRQHQYGNLVARYVPILNWDSSICGLFERNVCPKKAECNFLHVFPAPGSTPAPKEGRMCKYFQKMGVCMYGMKCFAVHPACEASCVVMLPHFFQDERMEKDTSGPENEFDEKALIETYEAFFLEVIEEFQECGKVVFFRCCRNYMPHLRGNVYIQYATESQAKKAVEVFNGRYFAGRRLIAQLRDINHWQGAICGKKGFFDQSNCPQGRNCGYLHLFENPPFPGQEEEKKGECLFFMKTGCCRYGASCDYTHTPVESSFSILIANFFQDARLEQPELSGPLTTEDMKRDNAGLQKAYKRFYEETYPQMESLGSVVAFKCARNHVEHLRGNVYVQFEEEEQAEAAMEMFDGRVEGDKPLSVVYCPVINWETEICTLFNRRKCQRKNLCNFLHLFVNPGRGGEDEAPSKGKYEYDQSKRRSRSPVRTKAGSPFRKPKPPQRSPPRKGRSPVRRPRSPVRKPRSPPRRPRSPNNNYETDQRQAKARYGSNEGSSKGRYGTNEMESRSQKSKPKESRFGSRPSRLSETSRYVKTEPELDVNSHEYREIIRLQEEMERSLHEPTYPKDILKHNIGHRHSSDHLSEHSSRHSSSKESYSKSSSSSRRSSSSHRDSKRKSSHSESRSRDHSSSRKRERDSPRSSKKKKRKEKEEDELYDSDSSVSSLSDAEILALLSDDDVPLEVLKDASDWLQHVAAKSELLEENKLREESLSPISDAPWRKKKKSSGKQTSEDEIADQISELREYSLLKKIKMEEPDSDYENANKSDSTNSEFSDLSDDEDEKLLKQKILEEAEKVIQPTTPPPQPTASRKVDRGLRPSVGNWRAWNT